ncbi:MAG TPA: hypothetical protein VIZ64_01740, partial [Dokdonella sp.]
MTGRSAEGLRSTTRCRGLWERGETAMARLAAACGRRTLRSVERLLQDDGEPRGRAPHLPFGKRSTLLEPGAIDAVPLRIDALVARRAAGL